MSNFYKQRGFTPEHKNVRVINSNRLIEEKLEQVMREYQASLAPEPEEMPEGFVEGITAEQLPAEEAEPEISLDEIKEQADRMIEEAKQQATQLLEEAMQQAEVLKNNAMEQGREEGIARGQVQAEETLREKMNQLQMQEEKRQSDYEQEMNQLEAKLLSVIVSVVEQVFHIQFDDKKDIMLYLISNAISNIESSKEFSVRVSRESYDYLNEHKEALMEYVGQAANIELLVDMTMKENECVIETDSGMFDCSMGVQLENLIKDLRSLCL